MIEERPPDDDLDAESRDHRRLLRVLALGLLAGVIGLVLWLALGAGDDQAPSPASAPAKQNERPEAVAEETEEPEEGGDAEELSQAELAKSRLTAGYQAALEEKAANGGRFPNPTELAEAISADQSGLSAAVARPGAAPERAELIYVNISEAGDLELATRSQDSEQSWYLNVVAGVLQPIDQRPGPYPAPEPEPLVIGPEPANPEQEKPDSKPKREPKPKPEPKPPADDDLPQSLPLPPEGGSEPSGGPHPAPSDLSVAPQL